MSFQSFLAKLPSTNFRIFFSVCAFVFVVITAVAASAFGRPIDGTTLYSILGALLIAMGLDVAQFYGKRRTHLPGKEDDGG